MRERTIKLTMTDEAHRPLRAQRQTFLITLNENGAEIRFSRSPIASRDRSIETTVGTQPDLINLTIHVEEIP